MKNEQNWKETVIFYNNGELVINEDYVGARSLLVSKLALPTYKKVIQEHAKDVLLDLGCGTVPYYGLYKNQVNQIICIDWAESYHDNIHLDYIADLNKEIPLDDSSVDTIILTDVLEHISNPYLLMSEISRVMRKGGKLILGVPFFYWLHEEPYDFHRYTKHQLLELCRTNSLNIISIQEVGGPITVISDIIAKNLPSIFLSKFFQKVMITFLNTRVGKKLDDRNKKKFPRSYCLVAEKI